MEHSAPITLKEPTLSIIVPTLNEESVLPHLFDTLSKQVGIDFELILSDGGSTDTTCELIATQIDQSPVITSIVGGGRGRARQLNRGAENASGRFILFLHADSSFPSPLSLKHAVDSLQQEIDSGNGEGDGKVAGRFRLQFVDTSESYASVYFYHEVKARLNRPGCIHGDQGMMFPSRYWQEVGPFDEALMILEDTFLADRVLESGRWLLFPDIVQTSARRFESEGMQKRRALNALIMNFAHIGWTPFFEDARKIYKVQGSHDEAGELNFSLFLNSIQNRLNKETVATSFKLWYQTGRYICRNSWQLFYMLAAKRGERKGLSPDQVKEPLVSIFLFQLFTRNPIGYVVTALGTWCWFHFRRVQEELK